MDTPVATERAGPTPHLRIALGAGVPPRDGHHRVHRADGDRALDARPRKPNSLAGLPGVGAGAFSSAAGVMPSR